MKVKVEVVGPPVDVRVGLGEPRFPEDKVVFFERVEEGLKGVDVGVASELDGNGVLGDGRGAVGEDDRDGRAGLTGNRVLLLEGGTDDIAFCSTVDEDASKVAVDRADESEQGAFGH